MSGRNPDAANRQDVRPWVKRLGVYLRIFGNRNIGEGQVDYLIKTAKEREAEHGR